MSTTSVKSCLQCRQLHLFRSLLNLRGRMSQLISLCPQNILFFSGDNWNWSRHLMRLCDSLAAVSGYMITTSNHDPWWERDDGYWRTWFFILVPSVLTLSELNCSNKNSMYILQQLCRDCVPCHERRCFEVIARTGSSDFYSQTQPTIYDWNRLLVNQLSSDALPSFITITVELFWIGENLEHYPVLLSG